MRFCRHFIDVLALAYQHQMSTFHWLSLLCCCCPNSVAHPCSPTSQEWQSLTHTWDLLMGTASLSAKFWQAYASGQAECKTLLSLLQVAERS
mmetsp:Transcript_7399/g.22648  ORF Transcript_7399/g.22648 Transcript_7399/m.22648 type:complete len:92 (-) Transcript_7399:2-277(-)